MKTNKKLVFANNEEEKVYNRGVSAGYFNIQIENISHLDEKYLNLYELGKKAGAEKQIKNKSIEDVINERYAYILTLGYWSAMGEIEASSEGLEKDEKTYFKLGLKKAKEELEKEQGTSIDDYLEERRNNAKKLERVCE